MIKSQQALQVFTTLARHPEEGVETFLKFKAMCGLNSSVLNLLKIMRIKDHSKPVRMICRKGRCTNTVYSYSITSDILFKMSHAMTVLEAHNCPSSQ